MAETAFHEFLRHFEPDHDTPQVGSSSRNIAFRRQTWEAVGGYPEWLTLTAEDALFNFQLWTLNKKFVLNEEAVVRWQERPTAKAYFKMLYRYGFGIAEAQLYGSHFLRPALIAVFPPLLLFSRRRFTHFLFRYRNH